MAQNTFSVVGRLKKKYDVAQVSATFRKREFILEIVDGQYPQYVSFQLTQDKVSLIDIIQDGTEIEVSFNLRGREWTSPQGEVKYFNTLDAWRIGPPQQGGNPVQQQPFSQPAAQQPFQQTPSAPTTMNPVDPAAGAEGDDLPF